MLKLPVYASIFLNPFAKYFLAVCWAEFDPLMAKLGETNVNLLSRDLVNSMPHVKQQEGLTSLLTWVQQDLSKRALQEKLKQGQET